MLKRKEISLENRVKIQLFHEQGRRSQKVIAKLLKCSRCAVQSAIKRFVQTGTHANKPRSGRKRVTTKREDRNLMRESMKHRKKTSSELAASLSEEAGKLISARTVTRRLREVGLNGRKAREKPWLSETNKRRRLEVLETALMPSLTRIFGETNLGEVIFQQDSAPCHKSQLLKVSVAPAQSPDLNPIEHLWGILKRRIKEHNITSKTALKMRWCKNGMP
nr:unnamed protein product [Callosobruchus chinensis]